LPQGPCITADFSAQGGANATTALLSLDDPPTAIVYANDLMAIAGMSTATSRGVKVPEQLSVTGFDDTPLAAYLQPALTTVRTDVVGWGRAAATRLLAVIDDKAGSPIDLPEPEFVVRASTAPPSRPGSHPGSHPGIGATSKDRHKSAPIRHRKKT
jgi:DNA-binding LacI/PurR family transcriptional regulator